MIADTTLIVRDDRPAEEGAATASLSSGGIVLDALPYVEPLDPNYEEYALSLIEEELRHVVAVPSGGSSGGEHPSLGRILPEIRGATARPLADRAPIAAAAYDALVSRRRAGAPDPPAPSFDRRDPLADVDVMSAATCTTDRGAALMISDLRTSVAVMRVRLEVERARHANLELHKHFETPARYAEYASLLENDYSNPTKMSVERQRRIVDGINGTRMEEQAAAARKLDGMARRFDGLVDKNRRLGRALGTLEGEVDALRKEAAAVVPPPPHDDGEGRNANGGNTMTPSSTTISEISEITRDD